MQGDQNSGFSGIPRGYILGEMQIPVKQEDTSCIICVYVKAIC